MNAARTGSRHIKRGPRARVLRARVLLAAAGATLVATLSAAAAPSEWAGLLHGRDCVPAVCGLEAPTPDERDAIAAEADRLLARYADDATEHGRACRALGATMRERLGEVRMVPVMWRVPDPEGNLAAVTGDAHTVEPTEGAGRVHIARGYDALNPARGLDAVVETARHEFAHLNGLGRRERWGLDEGAQLAAACGASAEGDPAASRAAR